MGARSGNNYLSALRRLKAEVWIDGERIADPSIHPKLVARARTIASLYDLQMEHPGPLTYRLDDGDRAGVSFIQPRNADEVRKRSAMFRRWAELTGATRSISPDQVNTILAAMAAAAEFFAASDPRFGANIRAYYHQARRHDHCTTYTSSDLVVTEHPLRVIETNVTGIIVSGSVTLAGMGGLAEELLVFAPPSPHDRPAAQALAGAINCNAAGLKFVCAAARPDVAQFGELDCTAIFDRVTMPWDRVFLCGDVTRCNQFAEATGVAVNLLHQAAVRDLVAAELCLGRASTVAQSLDAFTAPDVTERIAQMIIATGLMRDLLRAAETTAHPDPWSSFAPARAPLEAAATLYAQLFPAT